MRRIEMSVEARELMVAAFHAGRNDWEAIRGMLFEKGVHISRTTLGRWYSKWRAEQHFLGMVREQALAVAACHGNIRALSSIANKILLSRDWRSHREAIIQEAVEAFLKSPTPARATAAQSQVWLLLFEYQLATYQVSKQPQITGPRSSRARKELR